MKTLMPALGCIVLVAVANPGAACAQERYPSRPVQVIVPATAGGPVDTAIRIIEPGLSAALGEPVILQNRPGASGTVGMQSVATAEPNGYTIGQGVNSIFTITRIRDECPVQPRQLHPAGQLRDRREHPRHSSRRAVEDAGRTDRVCTR